jgi:hypothetical protein
VLVSDSPEAANRHHEFGSSHITKHFKLPFVSARVRMGYAIANFCGTIRKKRVRNLVCNGKSDTLPRLPRIEFDRKLSWSDCDRPCVHDVAAWPYRNTKDVG